MAIMAAMVTHEPSDWASLAKHLGTEETTLHSVSERLQLVHGMTAVGPGTIGGKLDAIADYWSRYHAKAIREKAEAMYRAQQDEHGFSLPPQVAKTGQGGFRWPSDAPAPSNPDEFADSLIAAIEAAKAVSYDTLATELGCGIAELMQACRNLSMNHGYDKLSSRSLHFYFQHHSDRLAALSRDTSLQP
ncbi:hypothetical protein HFO63_34090 [Rhizobium laguerreae]|uniref:hypothetical protein n=1 Tax=Rhizobium laguerreae TaxID=1076926 RepID=UPI001C906FDB|nr:hypothetical protein [Rhizobium laguerreae]MBY3150523.1 hypothetical protein [Rhizobium laguerreae]MBY3169807.1 hypothetical protein [Rhizobium laguerreae]MBY3193038.1 hypothetical protein [Rhizobium laguerreae]